LIDINRSGGETGILRFKISFSLINIFFMKMKKLWLSIVNELISLLTPPKKKKKVSRLAYRDGNGTSRGRGTVPIPIPAHNLSPQNGAGKKFPPSPSPTGI